MSRCEQRGVEAYQPEFRKSVVVRGRERTRVLSLFPGYVFARCDVALVLAVRGVSGAVRRGDCYCRLPDTEISNIRLREDEDGFVVLADQRAVRASRFSRNQAVRVVGGSSFAGQLGKYVDMDETTRHRALFEMLQRGVTMSFDDEELEAA